MKKYVVTDFDDCIVALCKTRADAEEYLFSESEEAVYEDFLDDILYRWEYWTPDSFFRDKQLAFECENKWRSRFNDAAPFESLYAFMLYRSTSSWYIQEVEEI